MQKQSLNTARRACFLGSADKCQQCNAVLGNNLHGFVWHCHGNPTVPPLPSSWNEPDCGTDPNVNIVFLIAEERWCLLLLKCSQSHRRHSPTNTLLFHWKSCSLGLDGCCCPRVRHKECDGLGAGHWDCSLGLLHCLTEHSSRNTAMVLLMFRLPKSL